jgi:tRNA(fMet)-specific endonuclease VapC
VRYLLDTDHISFLQRRSGTEFACLIRRMDQHSPSVFALSVVSFHEQVLGAHNFINRARINTDIERGYGLLSEILHGFLFAPVLPFDAQAIAIFEKFQQQRVRVSTMDLRIAAIAVSRNLTLLTRNAKDFDKVPGLILEDWTV